MGTGTTLDVAIVGAGAAGAYLADRLAGARPEWAVTLFERSSRIGGRLRSMQVDGLAHRLSSAACAISRAMNASSRSSPSSPSRPDRSTLERGRNVHSSVDGSAAARAIPWRAPGTTSRRRSATVRRSTSPWRPSNASCPGHERLLRPTGRARGRPSPTWTDRSPSGRSRTPWRRSGARRATDSSRTPSATTRDSIRTTPRMPSNTSSAATTRALEAPRYRSRAWTGSRVPSRPDSRSGAGPSSSGRMCDASRWRTASCGSSSPTGPRPRRAGSSWRSRFRPSLRWSQPPRCSVARRGDV